jgi:hypothetical protein
LRAECPPAYRLPYTCSASKTCHHTFVVITFANHNAGGLTANDFIVAAKVNKLDLSDVLKKKRAKFWA